MGFIVIEGLDGAGKSTQINLLRAYLEDKHIPNYFIHFPRTETGLFGELIARFLRGEMGNIGEVDPYLVALLYAGDRKEASRQIREETEKGKLVLADRYVYSNIAFQCAKFDSENEQTRLREWILDLEFRHYAIPEPDLNLFLDVPFSFTKTSLSDNRKGSERGYLQGSHDIHEKDLSFQQRVAGQYRKLLEMKKITAVTCFDEQGKMLPRDKVFERVLETLKPAGFI